LTAPLHESPWGAGVATYLVLTGAVSGAALVAPWMTSSAELRGAKRHQELAASALVLFAMSFALLTLDLGRPGRFWTMLSHANAASPRSFGVRLLVLEAALTLAWWLLVRRRVAALARGDITLAPGVTATLFLIVPALTWAASLALAVYPAWLLSRTWLAPLSAGGTSFLAFLSSSLMLGWGLWTASVEPHRRNLAIPAFATLLALPHAVALGADDMTATLALVAAATIPTILARRASSSFLAILSGAATRVFLLQGPFR
jgi:Polysulphide reductase, NrfD